MDSVFLWPIIQTGADDAEPIRCQYPAMQLIGLVLLIFLIRYLLQSNLRFSLTQLKTVLLKLQKSVISHLT